LDKIYGYHKNLWAGDLRLQAEEESPPFFSRY